MELDRAITVVGAHAEGEVGRVITGGVIAPAAESMFERMTKIERDMPWRRKVLSYIEGAVSEGAQLMVGGGRSDAPELQNGFFVEPTVLYGVTPDMTIFSEEVFGPVLAVTEFEDAEDAVALANQTSYGLANGVWTSNLDTAMAVSRA